MAKVIIITGTPGTGKTTVAKKLAKLLGYRYIDVNQVIAHNKLSEGYDRKRKCKIIDAKKLNKALVDVINDGKDGLVIDSHLSHFLPNRYVDVCIVTRCKLKTLKRRLTIRGYDPEKIHENLESEIFEVCLTEAKEKKHKIVEVSTDKQIDYKKLIKKIK
jgi:adenylate kinase